MALTDDVQVDAYREKIETWRQERDDSFRSPDGWLSLVGLFNLADGEYQVGSNESQDARQRIQLPANAPAEVGVLRVQGAQAIFSVAPGIDATVEGLAVTGAEMLDNRNGRRSTVVKFGTFSINLHRYGEELALRVRDSASPSIQAFQGCKWYAIQPEYRVQGLLQRLEAPSPVMVKTSVDTVDRYRSVGAVEFELLGQRLQLLAASTAKTSELFLIFRDATSGLETYGAGRYLYAEIDETDRVLLDFNKAYNPPCAFTPFATCALPPAQNRLAVRIEAGERD